MLPLLYDADVLYDTPDYTYDGIYVGSDKQFPPLIELFRTTHRTPRMAGRRRGRGVLV